MADDVEFDRVGWAAEPDLAGRVGFAPLTSDVTADVCVVGLGGSGLAAVGELIERGVRVVGLDAGSVAAGAAGRNGGFLLAGPAVAVHTASAGWVPGAALALYRETLVELERLHELLGPSVIRRVGSLRLAGLPSDPETAAEAADRAAELTDCEAQFELMSAHGLAVERYDGGLGRGLFLPDDAAMNPMRRAYGLAARYAGPAQLFEQSPVTAIDSTASGAVTVRTARAAVSAGAVIVAVDGRLEVLLPELAGRVRSARLQMLSVGRGVAPADRLPCPVYGRWGYDYAQQLPDGRLFVGGGRDRFEADEWTTDARPTEPLQSWLTGLAGRFAGRPVADSDVTHRWAATVGYTSDARALVTEVRPGVVACGGYNGTGNLVGPVAARAAVALALDGTRPEAYFAS